MCSTRASLYGILPAELLGTSGEKLPGHGSGMGIDGYLEAMRRNVAGSRPQADLAEASGIPLRSLARYLSGDADMPISNLGPLIAASRRNPAPGPGPRDGPHRTITLEELVRDLEKIRERKLAIQETHRA